MAVVVEVAAGTVVVAAVDVSVCAVLSCLVAFDYLCMPFVPYCLYLFIYLFFMCALLCLCLFIYLLFMYALLPLIIYLPMIALERDANKEASVKEVRY